MPCHRRSEKQPETKANRQRERPTEGREGAERLSDGFLDDTVAFAAERKD